MDTKTVVFNVEILDEASFTSMVIPVEVEVDKDADLDAMLAGDDAITDRIMMNLSIVPISYTEDEE